MIGSSAGSPKKHTGKCADCWNISPLLITITFAFEYRDAAKTNLYAARLGRHMNWAVGLQSKLSPTPQMQDPVLIVQQYNAFVEANQSITRPSCVQRLRRVRRSLAPPRQAAPHQHKTPSPHTIGGSLCQAFLQRPAFALQG
jgi:hypothetical protein